MKRESSSMHSYSPLSSHSLPSSIIMNRGKIAIITIMSFYCSLLNHSLLRPSSPRMANVAVAAFSTTAFTSRLPSSSSSSSSLSSSFTCSKESNLNHCHTTPLTPLSHPSSSSLLSVSTTRLFSSSSSSSNNNNIQSIPYNQDIQNHLTTSGYKRPTVNWYPGHIAKAEKLLSETLRSVDVLIEVRDARAPKATAHPRVAEWSAGRPRVVVLTRVDMVPGLSVKAWKKSLEVMGAGRWDGDVDLQIRNQAMQALLERDKYVGNAAHNDARAHDSNGEKDGKSSYKKRPSSANSNSNSKTNEVSKVESVLFIDAKRGAGIHAIHRAVLKAGSHINARRLKRGLSERPLRVGIIGYPNVGKSALINKILGKKRARTANTPGVTRTLQWIRVRGDGTDSSGKSKKRNVGKEFELLDSPGIIPANMVDQSDALLLAACNSIGTGAYDNQGVASYLLEWIKTLYLMGVQDVTAPLWRDKVMERYGFDPLTPIVDRGPLGDYNTVHDDDDGDGDGDGDGDDEGTRQKQGRIPTGEDMLFMVADNTCQGDPENAARKILQDFRTGRMGPIALQLAPKSEDDEGQVKVEIRRGVAALGESVYDDFMGADGRILTYEEREKLREQERNERAKAAVETARKRGLELPPIVADKVDNNYDDTDDDDNDDDDTNGGVSKTLVDDSQIGKGMFDGW